MLLYRKSCILMSSTELSEFFKTRRLAMEKDRNLQSSETGEFKKVLGVGSLVMFGLAYMAPTVVFNYKGFRKLPPEMNLDA